MWKKNCARWSVKTCYCMRSNSQIKRSVVFSSSIAGIYCSEHSACGIRKPRLIFVIWCRTYFDTFSGHQSLPALRFHATHLKTKYFEIWRSALPSALLAKKAREAYHKAVLCESSMIATRNLFNQAQQRNV